MVRKDIYEGVHLYVKQGIKPNYSEIARQYNSDYRTVKTAYEKLSCKRLIAKYIETGPSTLYNWC